MILAENNQAYKSCSRCKYRTQNPVYFLRHVLGHQKSEELNKNSIDLTQDTVEDSSNAKNKRKEKRVLDLNRSYSSSDESGDLSE